MDDICIFVEGLLWWRKKWPDDVIIQIHPAVLWSLLLFPQRWWLSWYKHISSKDRCLKRVLAVTLVAFCLLSKSTVWAPDLAARHTPGRQSHRAATVHVHDSRNVVRSLLRTLMPILPVSCAYKADWVDFILNLFLLWCWAHTWGESSC